MNSIILISNSKSTDVIRINELVFCKADGSYSVLQFKDNHEITVTKNLHWFEEQLSENTFSRTHRSFLVNLNYIAKIFHIENKLLLTNGVYIPISRSRKIHLKEAIEML